MIWLVLQRFQLDVANARMATEPGSDTQPTLIGGDSMSVDNPIISAGSSQDDSPKVFLHLTGSEPIPPAGTTDHGQSIPRLESVPCSNHVMSEPNQSDSTPRPVAPDAGPVEPVNRQPAQASSETPAFSSAVQLTFLFEIASLELTPAFAISCLRLKPVSNVVSMCLEPSRDPQSTMNLQINFELVEVRLTNGVIGPIRLRRSAQQGPVSSESLAISKLEFVTRAGNAPVQLTPAHQSQVPVQLAMQFQIAAVEFSPTFEVDAIILNSTSKRASIQMPGAGSSRTDNPLIFQIENVQLGANNELGMIQVNPRSPGSSPEGS